VRDPVEVGSVPECAECGRPSESRRSTRSPTLVRRDRARVRADLAGGLRARPAR